jgi:hypothetical protein
MVALVDEIDEEVREVGCWEQAGVIDNEKSSKPIELQGVAVDVILIPK